MKIDAVIFDLDGTLLDTLGDLTNAVNHALGACGLNAFDRGRVRRYVGNGVPKLIDRALRFSTVGQEPSENDGAFDDRALFDKCLAEFTAYYDKHNADTTAPYDGVADMLGTISAWGLKSAIVTNKYDGAAQALKHRFFGAVNAVVGAAPDIRPKPAPDGVYKALRLIGADAARAVYVGDGETDIETAKRCGMPVIAVTWGFRDRDALCALNPDYIIDAPRELAGVLRRTGMAGA